MLQFAVLACTTQAVHLDLARPHATVSERFVSYAFDTAQLVGGDWWSPAGGAGTKPVVPVDLGSERLRALARELGPAYLRIGGSAADFAYYDFDGKTGAPLPAHFESRVTRDRLAGLKDFVDATGTRLFWDLNAGPGNRDLRLHWHDMQAAAFLRQSKDLGLEVPVYELGNEVNAYFLLRETPYRVSGKQYAKDFTKAQSLLRGESPGSLLAGPASAFWPKLGEPLAPVLGVLRSFLSSFHGALDVLSWHYYPVQSHRCSVAVRRASPDSIIEPKTLDEFGKWAREVESLREKTHPEAALWLSETGSAQCGGEPGLSDRFESSFWWLDELGQAAKTGHQVVVRQTLMGSDYGMIDERTLEPRPDYWASLLWKRLMGTRVLEAKTEGGLRVYAHCAPSGGGVSLLLLNVTSGPLSATLGDFGAKSWTEWRVTAPDPLARTILVNGIEPGITAQGQANLPDGEVHVTGDQPLIRVLPLSYVFVNIPDADASACR